MKRRGLFSFASIRIPVLGSMLLIALLASAAGAALAINATRRASEESAEVGAQAMLLLTEDYQLQLVQRSAHENEVRFEQLGQDMVSLSNIMANLYATASQLDEERFSAGETITRISPNGPYGNDPQDTSSVFVRADRSLDAATMRDIRLSAYLNLVLDEFLTHDPNSAALFFGTPNQVTRYYPNIHLVNEVDPDFTVTERPWYQAALERVPPGSNQWAAELYLDATGRGPVLTLSAPVYSRSGRLYGVVGIDLELLDVLAEVQQTHLLPGGYSFLIDANGRAIALPEQGFRDLFGRDPTEADFGIDLSQSDSPLASFVPAMIAGESGFTQLNLQDRSLFLAYAPLPNLGWSLGSITEVDLMMTEIETMQRQVQSSVTGEVLRRLLPISGGLLLVILILGLLFTRRLITPVRGLAVAAQRIGEGQYNVDLPLDRPDEIGLLARAFHRMAGEIQTLVSELEHKVAQRTSDLERRALQLQTAAEISRLATELNDPLPLMNQAIELIRERFGFYHASVFLLDESGNWAEVAASTGEAGRKLLARKHRLAVGSASVIGWVTANRLPRVAADVEKDPFHFKNPLLPETRAEIGVPLIVGKRLLGALDVQSTQLYAFKEDDVRAVEAIASELALAIDSANVLRETQAKLEQFEESHRVRARDSWERISDATTTTIVRVGPPQLGDSVSEVEERVITEQAIERRAPVISDDGREAAIPILLRGEPIATITARKPYEGMQWTEEEIDLMIAVGGQAALALESARQYAEEQRRVAELEVVNRISQAVSQLLRLDSLYRVVHHQINQVLGDTDMFICLYDAASDSLQFPYISEQGQMLTLEAVPMGEGLTSIVIRSRQPLLLAEDTSRRAEALGGVQVGPASRSWLGVPMMVGEDIIGAIAVQDLEREGRFNEDDAALLSTIASQVASAFQNARLLDQVQRGARRQRLIHEITSKIRRSPDMKTVLETTARELGRGLHADLTSIHIGNGEKTNGDPKGLESDELPASPPDAKTEANLDEEV